MINLNIDYLPLDQIDRIRPLLVRSVYKPIRFLVEELNNDLNLFWFNSILELVREKTGYVLAALIEDKIMGIVVYTDNPWETKVLGKKAGVLNYLIIDPSYRDNDYLTMLLLEKIINHALEQKVQLLLCKTYTDDVITIHALEAQGFLLMDTVLDCYFDFRRSPLECVQSSLSKNVNIRLGKKDDLSAMQYVARQAFQKHFGRYHADQRIGKGKATSFYEEWIKSSIEGYADWICVAEIDGRIVGFSIWKKPSPLEMGLVIRVGHYSLAGILPDFSGRGLFTALTYEGMKQMKDFVDIIEGPTHINNYGVQSGYARLHWRVCSDARHSLHKWLT